VDRTLFWRSVAVQAAGVIVLSAILVALPLPHDFFEDYGLVTGPLAWIACSLVTARVVSLPVPYVLFAALAGGIAGAVVFAAGSHWGGVLAGVLVFGAACAGYDPSAEDRPPGARGERSPSGA
jgi:hypothetical protein